MSSRHKRAGDAGTRAGAAGRDRSSIHDDESRDAGSVTRRDFFLRAGQAGGAMLVAPGLLGLLRPHPLPGSVLAAAGLGASPRLTGAGPVPEGLFSGLQWRLLGPFRGGRCDAVTGVPGRPDEFYFGHVNGGVWKTINGGGVWKPVFDDQPVASIGAIAVAPSSPDTVYVGSGESTLRDSTGFGNGVYKSTDAGATWTHIGLEDTQHVGRVAVHPHDPDTVFVAALGHYYGGSEQRGVFRSKDGGRSWEKVLYRGPDVGAVEVVIDSTNPEVVYAGLWNTRRPPWFVYPPSNGPGGGLFKSTDGGDTWTQLTRGLPSEGIGRTGIAVAATDPNRVYALVDCLLPEPGAKVVAAAANSYGTNSSTPLQGGFFRSDDGGESWTRLSSDMALWGRGWYFEHVVVDPTDADVVYVSNVSMSRSTDGGHSWMALKGSPGGDDYHQAWISPEDPNTLITSSDQGAAITRNAKADPAKVDWSSWYNQPTAQIYHISVDYRFPYWVTGAQQDSGAVAVRSRGKFGEISTRDWEPVGAGGESGCTAGDPLHPGVVYGGTGSRFDLAQNRFVPGTTAPQSEEPGRKDWTQPLVVSPADPRALYYGSQFVFKSTDSAHSWKQISPDLTRPNPGIPKNLDKAAADDVGNDRRGVVYTISPSPLLVPMVWIGTDDGLIQVTTDDGRSWHDVTPKALTSWSRVTTIEASHFDFQTAYTSVDRHQLEDFDPYIYRTRDMGKSWQRITDGLPAGVYVHVIKEDPERQGLLFAGTERGAFVSFDDGDHWQPLQLNLPPTSVRDFQVYDGDLIVGTHGRGFWVIDDISTLRQADPGVARAEAFLFEPATAIDVDQGGDNGMRMQKDEPQAENPPDGAYIDYWLRDDAKGPVTLEILDGDGKVLHTFSSEEPARTGRRGGGAGAEDAIPNTAIIWRRPPVPFSGKAGMHRAVWKPNTGGRGGGGGYRRGPREPVVTLPGEFTAKLTVNGKSYTQTFTVKPDPRPLGG